MQQDQRIPEKLDLLGISSDKSIVKEFKNGQRVFMSCPIYKFNDYKKKQQRSLLVTSLAVYNLKGESIKRRIQIEKISGVSISKIGTEFVLHIPSEYDYRYASSDRRDHIIYYILKAYNEVCKKKMPLYYRDQLCLVHYAVTKEDRKKNLSQEIEGQRTMYDEKSFQKYLQVEQSEKVMVRKNTKTLFSKSQLETVSIDDFLPKLILGRGAFGTVYLVEKKNTKDIYAMKSINKEDIVKKDQVEHTKTQKIILEHINHPFLVNLVYAFQTPSKLYFVMQFMKGGQLFQHLSNAKKFPEKQAKFYAMQIVLGLGYLHSKNFIYRDLKLENVLMDESGNVCLTDFGMAKLLKEDELAQTFCGTPQYLAPEVLEGKGYDKCADWWSLGVLTYQMMYGLPPFYNKSQSVMFKNIRQNQIKFSEKVNTTPECKDFLCKILAKNPKNRLGSTDDGNQILAHPWFANIDREKMIKKQLPTPFKPKVQGQEWLDGFDRQFITEKIVIERDEGKQSEKFIEIFKGF